MWSKGKMKTVKDVVNLLSHSEKLEVIRNYEQFEKDGFIDTCF